MANLLAGVPPQPFGMGGRKVNLPVKASQQLYQGGMLAEVSGALVPATTAGSGVVVGMCENDALGGASDGSVRATVVYDKIFILKAATGGPSDSTPFGSVLYAADDNSVTLTAGSFVAGLFMGMEDDGSVRVMLNPGGMALDIGGAPLQKVSTTIDISVTPLVGSADTNGTANTPANIGSALPAGAIVMAAEYVVETAPSGGSVATATLDVGYSGTQKAFLHDLELIAAGAGTYDQNSGSSAGDKDLPSQSGGKQVTWTLTPDGSHKLSALTAGKFTLNVYYFLPF